VANTNVIVFGLTMQGYVPPRSTEQEEHANHYTTDAVAKVDCYWVWQSRITVARYNSEDDISMIIAYIKDYSAMIDNIINKTSKYSSGENNHS